MLHNKQLQTSVEYNDKNLFSLQVSGGRIHLTLIWTWLISADLTDVFVISCELGRYIFWSYLGSFICLRAQLAVGLS